MVYGIVLPTWIEFLLPSPDFSKSSRDCRSRPPSVCLAGRRCSINFSAQGGPCRPFSRASLAGKTYHQWRLKAGKLYQWIAWREKLEEKPYIQWENQWFPVGFPLNQSIDGRKKWNILLSMEVARKFIELNKWRSQLLNLYFCWGRPSLPILMLPS